MNGFYRILNLALKDAMRWGYINWNPAQEANPPRADQGEISIMTLEEQGAVSARLKAEFDSESLFYRRNGRLVCSTNSVLFHTAALTGLRRGEIAALKFSDVDWTSRLINISRATSESNGEVIVKKPKSIRGIRAVDIDQTLYSLLAKHEETMNAYREELGRSWNNEGWLFVSIHGKLLPPRALNGKFSRLLKRAGLSNKGYGLHTLRHTHISQLLMRSVPPLVVSRRAGHASTSTTMNLYGHVIPQMAEGVIASHLIEIQRSWS